MKIPFWTNLVEKFKIVCSKWNMILRLFWICKIQWLYPFCVLDWKQPFFCKFGPINQNWQFELKFGTWTNTNMKNSIAMLICTFWTISIFFWEICSKIVCWNWNLEARLIWICKIWWWFFLFFRQEIPLLG